jgi:hypothetical protein
MPDGAKCAKQESAMPASSSVHASAAPFASVKLPAALVDQARASARPMRRSVAGQIEYWATLGRIVEHTGLSVQDARAAIEAYERREAPEAALPAPQGVDDMTARLLAAQAGGSLARRVRAVVESNRSRAV